LTRHFFYDYGVQEKHENHQSENQDIDLVATLYPEGPKVSVADGEAQ